MKPTNRVIKTFLHVGCGLKRKEGTTMGFNSPLWDEIRLDIDENVSPDVIGTMTDMSGIKVDSMNAVFSSHNIEHLYPHEVPTALKEFLRVLKPEGFLVITCPDLLSVCKLVVEDKLTDKAYDSPAGPITPLDILYGHRPSLSHGNFYMAHRCGFTAKVLKGTLKNAGFASIIIVRRKHPAYDLWALATVQSVSEKSLKQLATEHFPGFVS